MLKKLIISFFVFFTGIWVVFWAELPNNQVNVLPNLDKALDNAASANFAASSDSSSSNFVWPPAPQVWPTNAAAAAAWKNDPNNMTSAAFKFDVSVLSPAKDKYDQWENNVKNLIWNIVRILMIVLPTLSVSFMVVWGIMIITSGWASEKVTKWKNIIVYNIIAIVLALLVKLVIWILWSNAF